MKQGKEVKTSLVDTYIGNLRSLIFMMEDNITNLYGEQCDDYEECCVCCKVWQKWETFKESLDI